MKLIKNKIHSKKMFSKLKVYGILASLPLPAILSFAFKCINLKEQAKVLDLYNKIKLIPQNPSEMENFANKMLQMSEGKEFANTYYENLNEAKQSGVLSDSLLNKYQCDSTETFESKLMAVFEQAKLGDIDASKQFDEMVKDYDNDAFLQAYDMTVNDYTEMFDYSSEIPSLNSVVFNNMDELLPYLAGLGISLGASVVLALKYKKDSHNKQVEERNQQRADASLKKL